MNFVKVNLRLGKGYWKWSNDVTFYGPISLCHFNGLNVNQYTEGKRVLRETCIFATLKYHMHLIRR